MKIAKKLIYILIILLIIKLLFLKSNRKCEKFEKNEIKTCPMNLDKSTDELKGIKMTYKDKKRKIGSQEEVPKITFDNDMLRVEGYQEFDINRKSNIVLKKKIKKFQYIEYILDSLKKQNCNTLCDFGCNAGLTSLIAHNLGFEEISSFDHDPEYIEILKQIKTFCNIDNVDEKTLSFGTFIEKKFDIVFCGALIHWIFSLTAEFRNFDKIIEYLIQFANKYIVIEWVAPGDPAILNFKHIERNSSQKDEIYSTENFEKSVNKYGTIVSKKSVDGETRLIYVIKLKI